MMVFHKVLPGEGGYMRVKMSAVFFTFQAEKIGYFLPFLGVLEQEVKRL